MNNEQKQYLVVVEDEAIEMMNNHLEFLSNVSTSATENLINLFEEGFDSLEFMPQRCPIFRTIGTAQNYRRLIIGRRYQVIFSINEANSTVNVKYILDSRQNNEF